MLKDMLKLLREERGITKKQLADAIGIKERAYITYEYGQRDVSTDMLQKFADFYGVTTDYLLGRQPAEAPEDTIKRLAKQYKMTDAQRGIAAAYFYMDKENREKLLEIVRTFADSADTAESKESRGKFEKVKAAAYQNHAGSIPREAEYPQEMLDDMDKNAPLTDPDM